MKHYDVIIVGGGAAGIMLAGLIIQNNAKLPTKLKIAILEKSNKLGKKILISGGGKCNFTNLDISADNYISHNPHFCKSALSRYTQWDFMALMQKHNLSWKEKTLGQLFCEQKASAILQMLLKESQGVDIFTNIEIQHISQNYLLKTNNGAFVADKLIIASGGPSIPKMGATNFALSVAQDFKIKYHPFAPALVPLVFNNNDMEKYFQGLAGVSLLVQITCNNTSFIEKMLITHKGISGPCVLQISSYWQMGDSIIIDLLPNFDASNWLLTLHQQNCKTLLKNILSEKLPKKLAYKLAGVFSHNLANLPLNTIKQQELKNLGYKLNNWQIKPSTTEGFRIAEVAKGGVDTDELSSKTMEVKQHKGLYFIGESVDVTGWLGGYNFQWAWSSAYACACDLSINTSNN